MQNPRSIVIVGGGFAGTALARALAARLPEGVDLTLVSEESYTTFNPLLPEAVGASIFPEHVVAPLREVLMPHARSRFIMGRVTGADLSSASFAAAPWAAIARSHSTISFSPSAIVRGSTCCPGWRPTHCR